jgi:hypothetical protein
MTVATVLPEIWGSACDNWAMASAPLKITLREPGVAGSYELVERWGDGSLLLRPEHERLSDVLCETEGRVFRDDDFAAHLERVARARTTFPSTRPRRRADVREARALRSRVS